MARTGRVGTVVELRVSHGAVPEFGTVLMVFHRRTHRLLHVYQVVGVRGKKLDALICRLDEEFEAETPVWTWQFDR